MTLSLSLRRPWSRLFRRSPRAGSGPARRPWGRGLELLEDRATPAGLFAVGAAPGADPVVGVYDAATGRPVGSFLAFAPGFAGGVAVAVADFNADGTDDVVVAAGPGGGPHVKVVDGSKVAGLSADREVPADALLASFLAFAPGFTGGVSVAVGDVNADHRPDVIAGAGPGGGPAVAVFDGSRFDRAGAEPPLGSFFAYDPAFAGGVSVAAADVDGAPGDEIVTGAGPGGGPHVRAFHPDGTEVFGFMAYAPGFRGGVNVAAGDVTGDGVPELVTGPGPGGGPHVAVFAPGSPVPLASFYAPGLPAAGGARVGVAGGQVLAASAAGSPVVDTFDGGTFAYAGSRVGSGPAAFVSSAPAGDPGVAGLRLSGPAAGREAEGLTFTARLSGPAAAGDPTFTWQAFRVDGGAEVPAGAPAADAGLTAFTFTPPDNGAYRVRVTAGGLTAARDVAVADTPPAGRLQVFDAVEGDQPLLSFVAASDPSVADLVAGLRYGFALDPADLPVSYGAAGDSARADLPVIPDNGTYTLWGRVMDKDGGYTDYSVPVTVRNFAPEFVSPAAAAAVEGGAAAVSGYLHDRGVLDGQTVAVDWGDGTVSTFPLDPPNAIPPGRVVPSAAGDGAALTVIGVSTDPKSGAYIQFQVTHRYAQNRPGDAAYAVTLTATDKDGGTGTATVSVPVANAAPVLSGVGVTVDPIDEGDTTAVTGTYTDAGTDDAHTVTVAWGDGTTSTFALGPVAALAAGQTVAAADGSVLTVTAADPAAGTASFRAEHRYANNNLGSQGGISYQNLGGPVHASAVLTKDYQDIVTRLFDNDYLTELMKDQYVYAGEGNAKVFGVDDATDKNNITTFSAYTSYRVVASPQAVRDMMYLGLTQPDAFTAAGFQRRTEVSVTPQSVTPTFSEYVYEDDTYKSEFVIVKIRAHTDFVELVPGAAYAVATRFMEDLDDSVKALKELTLIFPVGTDAAGHTLTQVVVARDQMVDNQGNHEQTKRRWKQMLADDEIIGWQNATLAGNGGLVVTPYTPQVTVTDQDGAAASASTSVLVRSVAPALSDVTVTPSLPPGGIATLTARLTDPGVLDAHDLSVAWGDGGASRFTLPRPADLAVGQTVAAASGDGTLTVTAVDAATGAAAFSVGRTYAAAGTFAVSLTAADAENGLAGVTVAAGTVQVA